MHHSDCGARCSHSSEFVCDLFSLPVAARVLLLLPLLITLPTLTLYRFLLHEFLILLLLLLCFTVLSVTLASSARLLLSLVLEPRKRKAKEREGTDKKKKNSNPPFFLHLLLPGSRSQHRAHIPCSGDDDHHAITVSLHCLSLAQQCASQQLSSCGSDLVSSKNAKNDLWRWDRMRK